jgi:hypothetical protein
MTRRFLAAGLLATALILTLAATALASHLHVRVLGNGECVILAEDGGERWVTLPESIFASNPNVVDMVYAADRQHPLHVLVHIAEAGNGMVYVLGSAGDLANCAGYVND